jgi:uncharacterized RDD family membrane protein YckC
MGGYPSPPPPGGGDYPPPPGPPPTGYPPPPGGGFPPPQSFPPAPPYGAPVGQVPYAGFWARFAALLIDGLIVALFEIPAIVVLFAGPKHNTTCTVSDNGNIDLGGGTDICRAPTGGTVALTIILALAAIVATVLYFGLMDGGSGQTLGKRALGIRVVDKATGGSIGAGRGIGRYFARILSQLVCYLGYLWMLWDPEKQCWHDKLVNSYVVKV